MDNFVKTKSAYPVFSHYSDEDLWKGIQSDNHLMFRELYNRYVVQLANQAYKVVQDSEHAKDLVQEVFLNLFHKRKELPDNCKPGAYLLISIRNRSLNKLRDQKIQSQHLSVFKNQAEAAYDTSVAASVETKMELSKQIQKMPKKTRMAFFLRHKENKSPQEIADVLGVSSRTVEKYLQNAFLLLKGNIDEDLI